MKKSEFIALSISIVVLVAGLVIFHFVGILNLDTKVSTAEMIEIIITFALALITFIYVKRTADIAKANTKMVIEAEKGRQAAFRPILSIDEPNISKDAAEFPKFVVCRIKNIGVGPAININWKENFQGKQMRKMSL